MSVRAEAKNREHLVTALKRIILDIQSGGDRGDVSGASVDWHFSVYTAAELAAAEARLKEGADL
ncbi:MAG TPA: hypothetical protein VHZ25_17940 [Acidobacteriaceae bacterium]|nr:hypothetical protein [Acidobacteriaceae bacterium]